MKSGKGKKETEKSASMIDRRERSAYFARREAARVLRTVLRGDARRRAVGSIKSLVYSPSVRNKKGTFALVCQTLKHLPLLKDLLKKTDILKGKWKRQEELIFVVTYDILFGQASVTIGASEKFVLHQKNALESALAHLCAKKNVKHAEDLLLLNNTPNVSKPRYVRVNTLKLDVELALQQLKEAYKVKKDDMVPDLLVLPPGTDLHNHPLVMNGSLFLQGKASSMVAVALMPEPEWEVLDACSAPGNKTVHLAALIEGKGKIIAYELDKKRVKYLEDTVRKSGANNVDVIHGDFLETNIEDPLYSNIRAVLVDPSCSGSGTIAERLDHLLPSYIKGHTSDVDDAERVKKLAAFQRKALAHALSFPAVERVVYSTCSIFKEENEDVIKSVLPLAHSLNFELGTPFPRWPRRGLPVFDGAEHLLRMDPKEDKEGFFIALFVRKSIPSKSEKLSGRRQNPSSHLLGQRPKLKIVKRKRHCPFLKISQMLLYNEMNRLRYLKPSMKN
ncbi:hypothetical protein QJS10_CPB14g01026 [Acorus calamus]|uniref:SAM-dependent MTase RsmB/NOP-type domain-containing protein n=1 Tax=Acorus calamus TaxID=4465 RepID=A0AAV9DCV7_ACOCL|nr:hypothetical protein QJS10_CPB14g01026 [Acorus calamus]